MAANDNAQTITSFTNWLKDHYEEGTQKQFYERTILLDQLEKVEESVVFGNQWVDFIHTGRNVGGGPVGETDFLHIPGKQAVDRAVWTRKTNVWRSKISDFLMAASGGNMAAARALDFEMRGMTENLSQEVNRQLYGDGTGILATVKTNSSSTTR